MTVLTLDKVSVQLAGKVVVNGVSFSLAPGEVLAVIGANGSGKSSLLRAICGDLPLHSGDVIFAGKKLQQWSIAAGARQLAVLPQFGVLEFPFTVEEVIALGRSPHSAGIHRDREIIQTMLELCDLAHLRQRLYTQLSGGEKRRVQLARVLAQLEPDTTSNPPPRLLLLDEPSAALDLAHQQCLSTIIEGAKQQGVAVVIVEHDLNLALRVADRVLGLMAGDMAILDVPERVASPEIINDLFGIDAKILTHPTTGRPVIVQ